MVVPDLKAGGRAGLSTCAQQGVAEMAQAGPIVCAETFIVQLVVGIGSFSTVSELCWKPWCGRKRSGITKPGVPGPDETQHAGRHLLEPQVTLPQLLHLPITTAAAAGQAQCLTAHGIMPNGSSWLQDSYG